MKVSKQEMKLILLQMMRGRINILATVGGCDPAIKVDLSYINVQGEQEYTPEFYNHYVNASRYC